MFGDLLHKTTAHKQSEKLPCPERVTIPLKMHIGSPCKPCVKPGDAVAVGDVIGTSDGYVSADVHSSVSGTVMKLGPVKLSDGSVCDAVTIKSDGKMRVSKSVKPPKISDSKAFIDEVRKSGLVGLGGAGFPTCVKLDFPAGSKPDTLIINCAECEPYITADNRAAVEDTDDIMRGISAVMKYRDIPKVVIGIESNKPDAVKALNAAIKSHGIEGASIHKLPAVYPQGDEKVLIHSCTGRTLPHGKLPRDVGCIVMNISSAAFLGSYLRTGMPLVSKRVTVDGSAVKTPKNVIVPIGTAISDVIAFCGGYGKPCGKLMYGGPMMGIALPNDSFPIIKQNNAVLAFDRREALLPEPTACIRCGKCAAVCPMHLVPAEVERAVKLGDVDKMKRLCADFCLECGSCAFNCPARRPLVQTMRIAKAACKNHNGDHK